VIQNKSIFTIALSFVIGLFLLHNAEAKIMDEHIYIVPAGEVDERMVEFIKKKLPDFLPMSVKIEVSPQEKIVESAHDSSRKQYSAEAILNDISRRITLDINTDSALIITDIDLYSPGLNFVFGLADASKATCIISLTRLRNEFYNLKSDDKAFRERIMKEAVHELGHVWGLSHCSNPRCVMYFSNTLSDTDRKKNTFCIECQKKLRGRYSRPIFSIPFLR